jgi:hypothetical protein
VLDIDCSDHGFVARMKCLQIDPGPPVPVRHMHES